MKFNLGFLLVVILCASCVKINKIPVTIVGTWQLIAATTIEKDTTFSTFNPKLKMIKIINPTHFAFFSHDLDMGKDSTSALFSAGSGAYTLLKDSLYTEHLEYCNAREWENHSFDFTIKIVNDTLVQRGVEKIENLGIDHVIVETYKRVLISK